jgi:Zn-dependent peptidase ImmA (M78 family)
MVLSEMQEKANEILENANQLGKVPVDIVKLVTDKGFELRSMNFNKDTTGIIFIDENNEMPMIANKKLIGINENLEYEQMRFVVAHEFSHYILHRPCNQFMFTHRSYKNSDIETEKEADCFARCLLMPSDLFLAEADAVKQRIKNLSDNDIVKLLSVKFKTSPKKTKVRYDELLERTLAEAGA